MSNEVPTSDPADWDALLGQGRDVLTGWARSGLLVPLAELAKAWEWPISAVDQATGLGDVFSVEVGKSLYYPSVFTVLEPDDVAAVCSRLKGDDSVAKFVFWAKPHGGLGGLTPGDAIRAGQRDKVIHLAQAWSSERGLAA